MLLLEGSSGKISGEDNRLSGTKLEIRVHRKMYNSKIWKHFKTLYIEIFQNKVEFKCWVLLVVIKSRVNVYVEND